MAGKSKGVWYWKPRKQWVATTDGKRHYLGPEKKAAERAYHELMTMRGQAVERPGGELTVVELLDRVLTFVENNRGERPCDWYRMFYQDFLSWLVKAKSKPVVERLRSVEVTGDDVQAWLDGQKDWGPSTKRGAPTAIKQAFNYGVKHGLIDCSPVRGVEKPEARSRETPISQAEFDAILSHVPDEHFRDVLQVVWLTGLPSAGSRQGGSPACP